MSTGQRPASTGVPRRAAAGAWRVRAGRFWRTAATGFCFIAYGALGWLAGITLLPALLLWPGTRATRQRRIHRLVGWSYRALLATIAALHVGHVTVEGREWLRHADGKLLVANHPMYLDAVALAGLVPQADCVVKQAMWNNPWYGRFIRAAGYIGNAGMSGLVDACAERLQRGKAVILFPEGTRSTPGQPLAFLRGAAQVAVRSGCDILPVVIRCEPLSLGKGQKWHDVTDRPWQLCLRICAPRTVAQLGLRAGMPHGVAARHVNRALEAFFTRELARDGDARGDFATTHAAPAPRRVDAHASDGVMPVVGTHAAGRLARVLVAVVLLGYPVAIYLLQGHVSPGELLAGLLALLGLRALVSAWVLQRRVAAQLALAGLLIAGAIVVSLAFRDIPMRWLRFYPMLLDLGVAAVFLGSLALDRPLVERIARTLHHDLPSEAVAYTRRVTWAWGVLMLLVATASLYTALDASLRAWSLFNGVVVYIVIALAFALEYALRRHLRRKWGQRERLA